MTIQSTIQSRLESFPPSMRKIAETVLLDPGTVSRSSIAELALRCHTSQASVVRFCRALGLSGYVELRIALATEMGQETRRRFRTQLTDGGGHPLVGAETLEQLVSQIAFVETLSVEETAANLDMEALRRSIEVLDPAERIFTFGVGSSGSCAEDLQRKLGRLGRPIQYLRGGEEAMIAASFMTRRDVLIAFSHSGTTPETVRVVELAATRQASTVVVTNTKLSPMGRAARFVIETTVRETSLRQAQIGSRTAQALVADCLYSALAHKDLAKSQETLQRTADLLGAWRGSLR